MMCWQTGQDNGDLVQAFIDNKVKFEALKNQINNINHKKNK